MGYSHAVRHSILKKVLPPESRSVAEVSRETGIHYQTIRNWIKQSESGTLDGGLHDNSPRRLTLKSPLRARAVVSRPTEPHCHDLSPRPPAQPGPWRDRVRTGLRVVTHAGRPATRRVL